MEEILLDTKCLQHSIVTFMTGIINNKFEFTNIDKNNRKLIKIKRVFNE